MVEVKTLKLFWDKKAKKNRKPGDVFEATEARAKEIDAKIPGYISYAPVESAESVVETPAEPEEDLAGMTVAKLKALCAERGIDVPKYAKKAELVALLKE